MFCSGKTVCILLYDFQLLVNVSLRSCYFGAKVGLCVAYQAHALDQVYTEVAKNYVAEKFYGSLLVQGKCRNDAQCREI
jgi:hypothetical protein